MIAKLYWHGLKSMFIRAMSLIVHNRADSSVEDEEKEAGGDLTPLLVSEARRCRSLHCRKV